MSLQYLYVPTYQKYEDGDGFGFDFGKDGDEYSDLKMDLSLEKMEMGLSLGPMITRKMILKKQVNWIVKMVPNRNFRSPSGTYGIEPGLIHVFHTNSSDPMPKN